MLEHEPDWPRVLPWRDDGLLNSKRGGNALTAPSSFHIHVHRPNSRHPLILMSASQTFYTLNIYGVLEAIYHCHSSTTLVQDKGYSSWRRVCRVSPCSCSADSVNVQCILYSTPAYLKWAAATPDRDKLTL